jgi:hypothetical protein
VLSSTYVFHIPSEGRVLRIKGLNTQKDNILLASKVQKCKAGYLECDMHFRRFVDCFLIWARAGFVLG